MATRRSTRNTILVPDRRSVLGALGLATIVALTAWFFARTGRSDAPAITVCMQLYASAKSHADTPRIDGEIPLQRTTGHLNPLTCGSLRWAYPNMFLKTQG